MLSLICYFLLSFCSQQQLRLSQSELNRQVKQSSSVIQEKVPFNDTSEFLALSHGLKERSATASRHLFENIYVFVTDAITPLRPGVNRVMFSQTVILHAAGRRPNLLSCVCGVNKVPCRWMFFNFLSLSYPAELIGYNSLNVPPHNRRHQVRRKYIYFISACAFHLS